MLMETCRYRIVDGKIETKMFGMRGNDWDIAPGWHHDPKEAKAAVQAVEAKTVVAVIEPEMATNTNVTIISSKVELVDNKPVKASRFAKKLAEELGVDISKVVGTGKDGAIGKNDVTEHYNLEAEQDGNSSGSDQQLG